MFEPRRALTLVIALTVILSLLPARWLGWTGWFGRLTQVAVVPVSGPLAKLSRWMSPASAAPLPTDQVAAFEQEVAELKTLALREKQENAELRKALAEIRVLIDIAPNLSVKQVYAPVVGSAGDLAAGLLTIRAGSKHGLSLESVASGPKMQLIGRVTAVGGRTSTVLPITGSDEQILAVVLVENGEQSTLPCRLRPRGDGTLRGPVEDRRDPQNATPIEPKVGQEVRLYDPERWPQSAQMLVIGRIERVEPAPEQPLRKVITVRPTIERLDRVAQVIVRTSVTDDEDAGAKP